MLKKIIRLFSSKRSSKESLGSLKPEKIEIGNGMKDEEKKKLSEKKYKKKIDLHDERVKEGLSSIFKDEHGEMPDLTQMEKRKNTRLWWIFVGIASFILVLTAAAWTGFMIFKPFRGFQGKGLHIAIDGPQRVSLGQETTYFINWQNISSEPLAKAEMRVSFPTDFTILNVEPKPTDELMNWRLGSVPFGGRGTITVRGIFTGALGTQTAVQVVGTYRPATFNSDFESLATLALEYSDTVLAGNISVPTKILPGDKVKIVYDLENRGTQLLKNLQARIILPDGFVVETTASSTEGRIFVADIGDLIGNGTSSVSIVGSFASGISGEVSIQAEVGRMGLDGVFQSAQKSEKILTVLSGDLSLKLVINGSDKDRSISLNEMLRMAIGYENMTTEDIKDVVIHLKAEPLYVAGALIEKKDFVPEFLAWQHAEDNASGTIMHNEIIWTGSEISILKRLSPRQDGTIDIAVPILDTLTASSGVIGFQLVVEAQMATVGETKVDRTIKTSPMVFRFRSDADLSAEARFYSEEGAPLGSGPLPPVVGQTTTYRLSWVISKSIHELKNIKISAQLPKRVSWPNKATVEAGELNYDSESRLLVWTLNRMPLDVNELRVDFSIDLTPAEQDADRFADLLGEAKIEATDVQINELIVKTKPVLTTDLEHDEGAKSKGVVRKP